MRTTPVGVAQAKVLSAIGITVNSWQEAEQKFSELDIVVTSKRVGCSSEPVVSFQPTRRGGFNRDGEGEVYDAPSPLTVEQRQRLQQFVEKK